MSIFIKNNNGELIEHPPYKCKICGQYEIEFPHDIFEVCGRQDDVVPNIDNNYEDVANKLSFNQYKSVWLSHNERIMEQPKEKGRFVTEIFRSQK